MSTTTKTCASTNLGGNKQTKERRESSAACCSKVDDTAGPLHRRRRRPLLRDLWRMTKKRGEYNSWKKKTRVMEVPTDRGPNPGPRKWFKIFSNIQQKERKNYALSVVAALKETQKERQRQREGYRQREPLLHLLQHCIRLHYSSKEKKRPKQDPDLLTSANPPSTPPSPSCIYIYIYDSPLSTMCMQTRTRRFENIKILFNDNWQLASQGNWIDFNQPYRPYRTYRETDYKK